MTEYHHVEIEQYLRPDYWDGHSTECTPPPHRGPWEIAQMVRARRMLRSFFDTGTAVLDSDPEAAFAVGEIFEPNDWPEGTIVRRKVEELNIPLGKQIDYDALRTVEFPPPEDLVDPNQKMLDNRMLVVGDPEDISYQSYFEWGGGWSPTPPGTNGEVCV